jgi:S1-C subfamily serine protease
MVESILLTTTRVSTFLDSQWLTTASGFFFERDKRMFLVTSRHVVFDQPSSHLPDRLEITIHLDDNDLTRVTVLSLPLYSEQRAVWRQGRDRGGEVDVAVIELDRAVLPASASLRAFRPDHLQRSLADLEVGTALQIVGFPLGFYDTLHHLPVVRQAAIASSFGVRFQGEGCFLTDARMHRGMSGAPVVLRTAGTQELPWKLLGVHSSRMDMISRDRQLDDALGLNVAWYADILMVLTSAPGMG